MSEKAAEKKKEEPAKDEHGAEKKKGGGIGAMLRAFRDHGCREIMIVGRVRRPNLAQLRPDLGFWTNIPRLLQFLRGGDDAILRLVVRFFERHNLKVIGVHEAAPELIAPEGVLGRHAPSAADKAAIGRCVAALEVLGPFDAAQAAVTQTSGLVAVEGAEDDAAAGDAGAGEAQRRLSIARTAVQGTEDRVAKTVVELGAAAMSSRLALPEADQDAARAEHLAAKIGIDPAGWSRVFALATRAVTT